MRPIGIRKVHMNNAASSDASNSNDGVGPSTSGSSSDAAGSPQPLHQQHKQQQPPQQGSVVSRVRAWLQSGKVDKQKLAEYGLGAFAAYGKQVDCACTAYTKCVHVQCTGCVLQPPHRGKPQTCPTSHATVQRCSVLWCLWVIEHFRAHHPPFAPNLPPGIISNLNAGVLMTMAWMAVVRRSGVSPLEGEWAQFLAIYAGLWVGASFMRPIRLSMALAAAPLVNAFLDATQRRLRVSRGVAFGLLLAMIAAGSFTIIFGTITAVGGFPNGVPQVFWRR